MYKTFSYLLVNCTTIKKRFQLDDPKDWSSVPKRESGVKHGATLSATEGEKCIY